jgi:multiple sugar transport system permease protein
MQDEAMANDALSQASKKPESTGNEPASFSKKLKDFFKSRAWYRTIKFAKVPFQHLLLIIGSLFFVLPFVWMLSTALKSDQDLFRTPPTWLPYDFKKIEINGESLPLYNVTIDNTTQQLAMLSVSKGLGIFVDPANPSVQLEIRTKYAEPILIVSPRWQNFPDAISRATREGTGVNFFTYTKNSLIVSFFSILGTLISCTTAAYAFARIQWPGRDKLFMLVLASIMLPFQVTMIPLYLLFDKIGWMNSFLPLIVPQFFGNAFMIFLLRQFFRTIPEEMCDAARVDGASEWQIFTQLVLPLSKPVLATVTVFTFLWTWNDFLGPLLYLTDPKLYTMALGLQAFQGRHNVAWNLLMAASVVFTVPIIIAFFFAQKTFIEGVKMTGLKE